MTEPDQDPRLDQILDLMIQFASGDMKARLKPSPARDTIDAIITGFNLLAEELDLMYQNLEARVAERTKLLRRAQKDLELLALTDSLTGLANRTLLGDRIGQAIVRSDRDALPPAVLMLDLDEFKYINDSLGHGAGDGVLREIASRLRSTVREIDTVARLGGDEFAIVMPDVTEEGALLVAHRALTALQDPIVLGDNSIQVTASIGLRFGMRGLSADDLLRDADIAMYEAKGEGKGKVQVFEPSMHRASVQRLQMVSELRQAISDGQLSLRYQPIVRLADGRIVGAEALIRWDHPTRGLTLPNNFIALAEESGLISDLGQWVLRTGLADLAQWGATVPDLGEFALHVNITATELRRHGLIDHVQRILDDFGTPPSRLALEVSGSTMITGDVSAMQALVELKELGVSIEIDDFGTGYSSIAYLRELPVNAVKVDKSLVAAIGKDDAQNAFVRAVLQLIESVGLRAIVEGIETANQVGELLRAGAVYGQGYYFSMPVDARQIAGLLAADLPLHGRDQRESTSR